MAAQIKSEVPGPSITMGEPPTLSEKIKDKTILEAIEIMYKDLTSTMNPVEFLTAHWEGRMQDLAKAEHKC